MKPDVVLVSFSFFFSEAYRLTVDREVYGVTTDSTVKRTRYVYRVPDYRLPNGREMTSYTEKNPVPQGWSLLRRETYDSKQQTEEYGKVLNRANYLGERTVIVENKVKWALHRGTAADVKASLESMYFKRIVFDEFHEVLKTTYGPPFVSLRELKGRHMWGLTGTPALVSAATVSDMASLLHTFSDPQSNDDAQKFLDVCLRSNSWNVESISKTEKVYVVSQTRNERALYLAEKNNLQFGESNYHRRRLLALCTYFGGEDAAKNLDAAVETELERKKAAVERYEQAVKDAFEERLALATGRLLQAEALRAVGLGDSNEIQRQIRLRQDAELKQRYSTIAKVPADAEACTSICRRNSADFDEHLRNSENFRNKN